MLIRSGMVERADTTTALSLAMPTGRAARIEDLYLYLNAAAAEDFSVTIDRKTILQFVAASGLYLLGQDHSGGQLSIMSALKAAGLFPIIPLASGETLEITAPGASNYMEAVYDLFSADEVKAEEPNGSKSDTYRLFQMLSNSGVLATAGDIALDQSDLSSVFPAFPGGEVVPANTTMDLLAIFGAAASHGTGAANGEYTTHVKMLADREDILDMDLGGINFLGDAAVTADAVTYKTVAGRLQAGVQHNPPRIIRFDPPIEFKAGQELNVFATIARTGAGGDFVAGDLQLGLVFDVTRG